MRFNPLLLLLPLALLLAESQPGIRERRIEVQTRNGSVVIIGVDHAADTATKMESHDESIYVQVPRQASLEVVTSNGSIVVKGVTGAMHLTTSNGSIELALPAGIDANLSAHTSNSEVLCDLPVDAKVSGATVLEGTLGSGGPAIELRTSNGKIHVHGGSDQESVSSIFTPGEVKTK